MRPIRFVIWAALTLCFVLQDFPAAAQFPGARASRYACVKSAADGRPILSETCPEFSFWWPASSNSAICELKRVESYKLDFDGQGHAVIPLVLDKPRMMIVDTGGARSTLYSSVVKEMSLPTMDADEAARKNSYHFGRIVSVNGYVSDTVAIAPSISFGVLSFPHPTFSVIADSRTPPLADNEVVGTLGPSHLMTFDVEFDFASNKLNLYLQNHCPEHVVYWAKAYAAVPFTLSEDGHIVLKTRLDGNDVTAILDSGAPFSSIDSDVAEKRFKIKPDVPEPGATHAANAEPHRLATHRFGSLAIGGVEFRNAELMLLPDRMSIEANSAAPEMILGLREMSAFHIFIAYSENMIYLTLANTH